MSWTETDNKLVKEFKSQNFSSLMQTLNEVAKVADEMNHHPDFEVYSYNKIKFSLSSHDAGKVTDADYTLAKKLDGLFS
jgi:4a-hydroxytetrahydrobiopterin dehydratase